MSHELLKKYAMEEHEFWPWVDLEDVLQILKKSLTCYNGHADFVEILNDQERLQNFKALDPLKNRLDCVSWLDDVATEDTQTRGLYLAVQFHQERPARVYIGVGFGQGGIGGRVKQHCARKEHVKHSAKLFYKHWQEYETVFHILLDCEGLDVNEVYFLETYAICALGSYGAGSLDKMLDIADFAAPRTPAFLGTNVDVGVGFALVNYHLNKTPEEEEARVSKISSTNYSKEAIAFVQDALAGKKVKVTDRGRMNFLDFEYCLNAIGKEVLIGEGFYVLKMEICNKDKVWKDSECFVPGNWEQKFKRIKLTLTNTENESQVLSYSKLVPNDKIVGGLTRALDVFDSL